MRSSGKPQVSAWNLGENRPPLREGFVLPFQISVDIASIQIRSARDSRWISKTRLG